MGPYLLLFGAGFAGSFHCVGMCGGFACAIGRDPRGG
jgi:sulfite exporter TauE/SafE